MTQPTIYAATDATVVELESSTASTWIPETVTKAGKQYKRLTPEYWAWFYRKYCLMEKALVAEKVSEATFAVILDRISALYNRAVAMFGKEALDRACNTTNVTGQGEPTRNENGNESAPRRSCVPSLVAERNARPIRKRAGNANAPTRNPAAEKVDAVCDRATALGWTRDQLYRTDGIAYRDWGLVRFLDPDDEIGEITLQHIEIKNSKTGKSLYFYNHRVDQPWMRKSCKAGVEDGL